jgi:hypothetical protein
MIDEPMIDEPFVAKCTQFYYLFCLMSDNFTLEGKSAGTQCINNSMFNGKISRGKIIWYRQCN